MFNFPPRLEGALCSTSFQIGLALDFVYQTTERSARRVFRIVRRCTQTVWVRARREAYQLSDYLPAELRDAVYNARGNHFHPGFADVDPDTGAFEVVHYSATSKRMAPCVGARCDWCKNTTSLSVMAADVKPIAA